MITKILAKDFRGFSFDQEIGEKTLFVGPNNCGKTAHCLAMVLSIEGYIPGKAKGNAEILDTFGVKDSLHVGIQIGKKVFGRQFVRKDERVSERFRIDSKSISGKEYLSTLGEVGNPRIFDLTRFFALSDAKKIDELFNLFPPGEDLEKTENQIEKATDAKKRLVEDIAKSEGAAERLVTARAEMDLPSGTHAETTSEIKRINAELDLARKNLRTAEIKDAQAEAKAKAEAAADAAAKAKADAEQEKEKEPGPGVQRAPSRETVGTRREPVLGKQMPLDPAPAVEQEHAPENVESGADYLKDAIAVIERSAVDVGCEGICALVIIAKDQLRKLNEFWFTGSIAGRNLFRTYTNRISDRGDHGYEINSRPDNGPNGES